MVRANKRNEALRIESALLNKIAMLGTEKTAEAVGVDKSQISRWKRDWIPKFSMLLADLLLSPDNWPEYVNERIGIPHVWHVFVFALAFSLAINVHRLSAIASARYKRFKLRKRIKMQNDKVRSVIQNLTEEQSMVLCAALNEGRKYVVTSKQFPYISELIELGVLNKTFSRWNGKHILFPIEDIYWTELVASYDPYNIEIKPRPISK